jgi:hypothetical protein
VESPPQGGLRIGQPSPAGPSLRCEAKGMTISQGPLKMEI